MGLGSFLRRVLRLGGTPLAPVEPEGVASLRGSLSVLVTELAELRSKVEQLEGLQLDRELQWTETKDKLLRYLKRVQELDRRAGEEPGGNAARAAQLAKVLETKFPHGTPPRRGGGE